jgi:predicted extracellular nuclease
MAGNLSSGYILETKRVPTDDWLVQFAAGTTSNVPLADTYFGLKLVSTSVSAAALKAYYAARLFPEPYLTYLNNAADGINPFVYIKGADVTLVDAAQHDIGLVDVAMTIPDDYPVGTYTVEGVVRDTALNETTVTLKLIVRDSTLGPVVTITGATADGVPMAGDLATGFILETTGNPAGNHYLQFAADTTSDPALANQFFGLFLKASTITPAALKAYYVTHGTPSSPIDFLTYLQAAADGINPFVYIRGSDVTLVDAAKHDLMATDGDMTVPDDFPAGTYTVEGVVTDAALNETTVTLKLIVVAPTPPTGSGNANPASVLQGNSTLLTVNVTPGTYPTSTGLGVTCDLSPIGGSATQAFYDDATLGDVTAGDNIYSYSGKVGTDTAVGLKNLSCTITDSQARTGSTSIALTVTVNVCYSTTTPIYDIQGSGASSPLVGNVVTFKGVVTGDYTGLGGTTDFGGFYIQDQSGDANPLTSDGVFVYKKTIPVTVGNVVVVTGTVKEYNLVTEIDPVTSITDCGTFATPITPLELTLPLPAGTTFESYEGMLVSFANPMVVAQNYFLGRYGQMHLSTERFFNPTNGQGDTVEEFLRSSFVLDDGKSAQNPNPTPYLGANNTVRAGDTVAAGLTGFMDQGAISNTSGIYGYRLQPLATSVSITRTNARPLAPAIPVKALRVVGFNVENYFVTLDVAPYPAGSPYVSPSNTPRGADSSVEFTRQRDKLFAGLAALQPDVFGVTEIESWDGANAPADFVAGLNTATGTPGEYAFIADPATGVGSDPIQNGLFYKVSTVTPVGAAMSSTDSIYKRAPIAQTFMDAYGNTFSVIVNHFKSKGSCPVPGDPNYDLEKDNGQGCWTYTRTLEAQALLTFIQQVKTASGDPDVLVIGDLNSYGVEDPINTLTTGGLYNEMAIQVAAADRYSYIFDGYSGYLDHALTTATMHPQVLDVQPWHINADEPSFIDYNTEFKTTGTYPPDLYAADAYRSSDHDPIVIDIAFPAQVITNLIPDKIQKGSAGFTLTVNGANFNPASQVFWNGSPLTTTFVNTGQLTAQISAADVAAIDIVDVTVGDSTPAAFTIYTFADTLPTAWYWKWVEGFYAKGITTGCALNPFRYCPERPVTRAEMAVFILRAKNADVPGYAPSPIATDIFSDVPVTNKQWMQPWIEEFYEQGITSGCVAAPNLQFCPERQVTRAEMAVFILRAKYGASYTPPPATGIFSDVPVAGKEWMQPWIEQLYHDEITSGCSTDPKNYCPEQPVTRAQMAVFIDRAFGFPQLP